MARWLQSSTMTPQPRAVEVPRSKESPVAPSFQSVYQEHYGFVCRNLVRLGADFGDVEDLVHDVFLVVMRRLCDYDHSRPMRPWLIGIAARVLSDHRRSSRRRHERVGDEREARAAGPAADEQAEAAEVRDMVLRVLAGIDMSQRVVLVMHDLEGLSMSEITRELGIPLNTGYSRLRLGREHFIAAVRQARRSNGEATEEPTQGSRVSERKDE